MPQAVEKPPIEIVSARFRTATSPLRRLPIVTSRQDTVHSRLGAQRIGAIHDRVSEILEELKLVKDADDHDVGIDTQETRDCPETAAPTIMVIFEVFPTDHEALHKATKQIAEFAWDITDESFCVEMIDQRLVWTTAYGPVRDRPDLLQCWDKMRVQVYERLEAHEATRGSMTSISLFHYGKERFYRDNPVTIFITVDFDSQEVGWQDVIEDIEESLKKHHLPALYIHIEHNLGFSQAPPPPIDPEADEGYSAGCMSIEGKYNKTINLGEAIGPANFVLRRDWSEGYPGHGSLGCYVEVKTAAGSWEKYGLTNYHVVRGAFPGFDTAVVNKETVLVTPSAKSALLVADENGLLPGSYEVLRMMESPPHSMHDYTLWEAQRLLDRYNASLDSLQSLQGIPMNFPDAANTYARVDGYKVNLIREVEKKKDFFYFYQHPMGEVFAASGFNKRTSENGRLDWALVKVDERRTGANILAEELAWESAPNVCKYPYLTFGRQLLPQQETISFEHGSHEKCEEGFTYATTTGPASGNFHIFKTDVKLKDDQHIGHDPVSSEYLFQIKGPLRNGFFAGSIVYGEWGCVLGILSTGLQPQRARNFHACVTPIEHVFRHIKESSNGSIIDVRVARD